MNVPRAHCSYNRDTPLLRVNVFLVLISLCCTIDFHTKLRIPLVKYPTLQYGQRRPQIRGEGRSRQASSRAERSSCMYIQVAQSQILTFPRTDGTLIVTRPFLPRRTLPLT